MKVSIQVPGDSTTHLIAASGETISVTVDAAGKRWADIDAEDARSILNSGMPDCVAWRELNPGLVGILPPAPPPPRGVRWADLIQAAEDARQRSPFDKVGITRDTFRMMGREL
jgi:hypothetical protein